MCLFILQFQSIEIKPKHGLSLFSVKVHRSNDKDTGMICLSILLKINNNLHPLTHGERISKVRSQFNDDKVSAIVNWRLVDK